MIKCLSLQERARLCTALNRQFPFGLRATSETLQLFTREQIVLAAGQPGYERLREKVESDG